MSLIEVKNLTKTYRVAKKIPGLRGSLIGLFHREYKEISAVQKTNFTIEEGEFVGLLGPNGAGKTTILKMLAGILYPTQGSVEVLGYTPSQRNHRYLEQIALVLGQKQQLLWDVPPADTYLILKEIYAIPTNDYTKRLDELIELLDLSSIITTPSRQLSLGQRMRAELAAALLHQPKILFLDEPTIGLDVVGQKRIWDFLATYQKEKKVTIILTSHYMADIERLCPRVLVVHQGKLLYDGALAKLLASYSPMKRVTLTLTNPNDAKGLEKYGTILLEEGSVVTLGVDRKHLTDQVSALLKNVTVTDFAVQEPEAADIIREIFDAPQELRERLVGRHRAR